MKRYIIIFLYFLLIRLLFIFFSGYDSCQLCPDSNTIDELSNRALKGNFNFDIGKFVVAPFYQTFIALHKIAAGDYWQLALITTQVIISCLSGVFFYKLAKLLFSDKVAVIATMVFGLFPMTLLFVHTFCTEMLFQSILIIAVYFLVKSAINGGIKNVIISAVLFSIAFLTKSHILLFAPFIVIYYLLNIEGSKKITYPLTYGFICIALTVPFGIYNLNVHDQYILSSNGGKYHFYTGNSEFGYRTMVKVPEYGTKEFERLQDFDIAYFNGAQYHEIKKLPQKAKQDKYFQESINWVINNPAKFVQLKLYNLFFFLLPGVSFRHYPLLQWLFTFIISFPVYFLGYTGIYKALRINFRKHFFVLGLFSVMLIFSVVWYTQNRFRTVTLEPFYILYAVFMIEKWLVNKGLFKLKIR